MPLQWQHGVLHTGLPEKPRCWLFLPQLPGWASLGFPAGPQQPHCSVAGLEVVK